jgi:hypothetical protein
MSKTQMKVVRVLRRKGGVTRAQLVKAVPEAKPLYLSALLYRILKEKGFKVQRKRVEGEVVYSVT